MPQFLDYLKHVNLLVAQLSSAKDSDSFSNEELKRIFYTSMPLCLQTNFVNLGQNVQQVSFESLQTYMVQQDAQTDAHRKKTGICPRNLNLKPLSIVTFVMGNLIKSPLDPTPNKMRTKKSENNAKLVMTMTAPFMAAATNGGTVIRINTERTFILATLILPLVPTVTFPKVCLKDSPSSRVHPDKYKSITMSVLPETQITKANKAATALLQLPNTCLCIIKIQTTQTTQTT